MKYKAKKIRIFNSRFKNNYAKEEFYKRLDEIGYDKRCDEHGHMNVRLSGDILSETYLFPLSEIDDKLRNAWSDNFRHTSFDIFRDYCIDKGYVSGSKVFKIDKNKPHSLENIKIRNKIPIESIEDKKLYIRWRHSYRHISFELFRDYCIDSGYVLGSKVLKINIGEEYALENIRIFHPILKNTKLDEKIYFAWLHNYRDISFEVFKSYCLDLGFDLNSKVFRLDSDKPHTLENIKIHKEPTEKDKTKYSLLLKNHKLIHPDRDFKELKEIAIKSDTYSKLEHPFINKDLKVISLEESNLTSTQQKQIKRETKITQNVDTLMFEYQIRFEINDLKALRKYIEFCINNNQENPTEYIEGHHILMRSLFKEYVCFKENPWNKVNLSKKDHTEAHRLVNLALRFKSTRSAYNLLLSISTEYEDVSYLGKSVIIFDYLGNEIDKFPTATLAISKYGDIRMVVEANIKSFDNKDPKIAIYESEFTKERLNECVDFLKTKIVNIMDLQTLEVDEFSCIALSKQKYHRPRFDAIIFDTKYVAYYPYREGSKSRIHDAQELFNSRIVIVTDNKTKVEEEFLTPKLARKKYPKFIINTRNKTFDNYKYSARKKF